MIESLHRRAFITQTLACVAGATLSALGPLAHARATQEAIAVNRLTDNLLLVSGAGCNVIALLGADAVLMVDGGSAERSPELLRAIRRESGSRPVKTLFNTHWHPDHTGSNVQLGSDGATIIAHENTKLWLSTPIWQQWSQRHFDALPPRARPNSTFYTSSRLAFGSEDVEYGYLGQAHTDGDIYIYFRKANVLAAGDVVAVANYPILDYSTGGWIGGMAAAAQALVSLADDNTRIIPGIGPIQSRADVMAEQDMLARLKNDLWQSMRKGLGPEDMVASEITKEFDAKWGNPSLFVANAYRGLYGHTREMGGVV